MFTRRYHLTLARGTALLLVVSVAAACGESPRSVSDSRAHPTAENIPDDSELADIIHMDEEEPELQNLNRITRHLVNAQQVMQVGALEGDRHDVFGQIGDVAAVGEGEIAVLDARFNEVRIYNADGTFVRSFGRPGRGPKEFLSPEGLEIDQQGRFFVADRDNQIKVFEPRGGEIAQTHTIRLRFAPEDFCVMGGQIYVQGIDAQSDRVIHVFSVSGDEINSFGEPYQSDNLLIKNQLSDGRIACSEDESTIVMMFEHLPIIYGYSPSGELRWKSRLADFHSMRITDGVDESGRPYIQYHAKESEFDQPLSLLAVPDGLVILQVARHTPESTQERGEFSELRTYVLSAETGKGVYVGDDVPVIYGREGARLLTGTNDPFPQVQVYEMDLTGAK